ncbi:MAG TPA: IS1634 family transposase, partial [Thermoguttaceae bacterium]|nr:IS1634 family transposase [Thermoguttaceae bacterium]
ERSLPHGHVNAVLGTVRKLGLDKMIASRPSRQRQLVLGMIAQRILSPDSKLAMTRQWKLSTLGRQLGIEEAEPDELCDAMDWLWKRQGRIERKLAEKHLREGTLVLYDISSSYYEGHCCKLAKYGHNRDKKQGKKTIVYGLLTDAEGRPVAIEAFEGNTADPTTVLAQAEKLRERFALKKVVLVGDRGMITTTQATKIKEYPGMGWISAIKGQTIRRLIDKGRVDRSLFDDRNLAEFQSPEFPDERLIACYNPLLDDQRKRKREELLAATESKLEQLAALVARRRKPLTAKESGLRAGKIVDRFKVAKHFTLSIEDGRFDYARNEASIRCEEELDGIYLVRTSESREDMSGEDVVRNYKRLTEVERAFRCMKAVDLEIRPIRHRLDDRVRSHLFLCMLSHYVQWHMRESLAPLLLMDETRRQDRLSRDPVRAAEPSAAAKRKKSTRNSDTGFPLHSLRTLLQELGTQSMNGCVTHAQGMSHRFDMATSPTPLQQQVFALLDLPNGRST